MFPDTLSADIDLTEYIRDFRDVPRFEACCRACPAYGRSWSCPPLASDAGDMPARYRRITVYVTPVDVPPGTPADRAEALLAPVRRAMESRLLEAEHTTGGRASATIGRCLHCGDAPCRRASGLPCLHPDKVRPSLEALGFDISLTLERLFGIKLEWGRDGMLPPRLHIVTALMY